MHVACGQQPGRLQVQQGGGDHQERGGLIEAEAAPDLLGVGDELVGDLVQRHFGDVEPVGEDQLQQQVERALEIAQPNLESGRFVGGLGGIRGSLTRRTGG